MKKKLFFISTLFFILVNCSPISSIEGLHSTSFIPAPPQVTDTETKEDITQDSPITLSITKLDIDETTGLNRSFSELYLAFFIQKKNASKSFLPIEQLLYENSVTQMPIPINTSQPNKTVYICLVSGRPDIHGVVYKDQKKKCRSFSVSELLRISKKGYELSLEDRSSQTPRLELLIHTS